MKFDTPATENPIDRLKVVGRPTNRIDGPLKTSGTAPYAYARHDVATNQSYGYFVGSATATRRISASDPKAALAEPGVLAVVTAARAGTPGHGRREHGRVGRERDSTWRDGWCEVNEKKNTS